MTWPLQDVVDGCRDRRPPAGCGGLSARGPPRSGAAPRRPTPATGSPGRRAAARARGAPGSRRCDRGRGRRSPSRARAVRRPAPVPRDGGDPRAEQPRPRGSLVVRGVADGRRSLEPRPIAGLERGQRPHAARDDEMAPDRVEHRCRLRLVDEVVEQAEREELVRAERGVVAVRPVDDVAQPAALAGRGSGRGTRPWRARPRRAGRAPCCRHRPRRTSRLRGAAPRSTAPGSRRACRGAA